MLRDLQLPFDRPPKRARLHQPERQIAQALVALIEKAKEDMRVLFNAPGGRFFVAESGTELLFRLIRTAIVGTPEGRVLGSTLEHPATRSAAKRAETWPTGKRQL